MFIHRPDIGAKEKELAEGKIQPNVAEIIIAKHRNGATGSVKLYFKAECTKFINFNEDTGEPDEKAETPVKAKKPSLSDAEEMPPSNENVNDAQNAEKTETPPFDAPNGVKDLDDEIFG